MVKRWATRITKPNVKAQRAHLKSGMREKDIPLLQSRNKSRNMAAIGLSVKTRTSPFRQCPTKLVVRVHIGSSARTKVGTGINITTASNIEHPDWLWKFDDASDSRVEILFAKCLFQGCESCLSGAMSWCHAVNFPLVMQFSRDA